MQVDFGQYRLSSGKIAYLLAAILPASRYRYIAVQDHPFQTLEVILHLLDCFATSAVDPKSWSSTRID